MRSPVPGHDVTVQEIAGVGKVMLVLPVVPEDAPAEAREGIARRRLVMLAGECPCGARRRLPNRAQRRAMRRDKARGSALWETDILHADECPALDEVLARHGWAS